MRKNVDKGINMQMVTDVQRIVIAVEHHLYDLEIAQRKLDQLKPLKYNRWLVVFMIGLFLCGIRPFIWWRLGDLWHHLCGGSHRHVCATRIF